MIVKMSRVINGEKCYYGTYNLSVMAEAEAFAKAAWIFGENGDALVVEADDGEKA